MSKLASLMSNYTLIQKVIKGNVISDTQAVSLLKLQHEATPALIAVITISSKVPILSNNPQNRGSDSVNIRTVPRRANRVSENRLKRSNIPPVSACWMWSSRAPDERSQADTWWINRGLGRMCRGGGRVVCPFARCSWGVITWSLGGCRDHERRRDDRWEMR